MSTKILVKRSSTAGAIPTLSQLSVGELAINTADKRVFTNNGTAIVELGTTPSTQAVAGNATVGGTLGVTGATTLDDGTIAGDFTVTGSLTVPTPTATGHAATKNYVDTAVANVLDSAPDLLNTLNELAAALGDDENFATNVYNAIALKLNKAGDTMTGTLDMGANKVTTTLNPTTDNELTRKGYVDGILGSATAAATSAANAATSESNAATSETNAATSATAAASSANAAANSATNAGTSETNAATSASSASTSATQAATSATAAGTSETNAATSATNAASSETAAASSETNAASSATAASNSATAASNSATAAASSATAAASSETTATTKASEASTSATNAATSEANAASSATAAAADAATVAGIYDSFDDRYLGSKASAPALDNDGNALLNGALYWNSTDTTMYVWGGSSWMAVGGTPETLQSIGASISDTAVDVFVYDTRKDSDGGAWRKRTQHTSWYNETLNTATRGSRKEFPAVAVIVAETTQVTIYDGDDPDLPMWMVCNTNSSNYWIRDGGTARSLSALNGILLVGANGGSVSSSLLSRMDFLKDRTERHFDGGVHQVGANTVAERNSMHITLYDGGQNIVSRYVNDIAMTVLPNAPIDPATQLPIPTIAVATDGGVSVIKDDGSVVDITFSGGGNATQDVTLVEDMLYVTQPNSPVFGSVSFGKIPSSDVDLNVWRDVAGTSDNYQLYKTLDPNIPSDDITCISEGAKAFGFTQGLVTADVPTDPSFRKGMTSLITSTYNTGWMNGDIKLATLSDTDATNVTGTELVTNGTFDSDTSWTKATGWTISGGVASITTAPNATNFLQQSVSVEAGKKYQFICDVVSVSAGTASVTWTAGTGDVTGDSGDPLARSTVGELRRVFTCVTSGTINLIVNAGSGSTLSVDNVTLRVIEEDRSVNNKGLQVFGTVTKTPVATGADLVAYSGFSASNYLEQPYNSDLDFGTGDFCVMGWVKAVADSYQIICQRAFNNGSAEVSMVGLVLNNLSPYVEIRDASGVGQNTSTTSTPIGSNVWSHLCGVRRNGVLYMYANGKLISTATGDKDVSNSNAVARVGVTVSNTAPLDNGSAALVRISATAPTAEQIAKIYEDEKVLFQEGAQATLYGSSDAVTALAYDDTTDILHVGTSAGRSDFSGLRRVSNTTDAVGVALSASNGMIVEE